jgi:hypothetical protein
MYTVMNRRWILRAATACHDLATKRLLFGKRHDISQTVTATMWHWHGKVCAASQINGAAACVEVKAGDCRRIRCLEGAAHQQNRAHTLGNEG